MNFKILIVTVGSRRNLSVKEFVDISETINLQAHMTERFQVLRSSKHFLRSSIAVHKIGKIPIRNFFYFTSIKGRVIKCLHSDNLQYSV